MKQGLLLLSFVFTACLTACSTTPTNTYQQATPLVQNNPTADNSVVVVRRDTGVMGSACPVEVYLDGKKYAILKTGESININTQAGTHILSAKFAGRGFCQDRLNETEIVIKPNESKYYRLAMNSSGDFHIFPTLANPIQ